LRAVICRNHFENSGSYRPGRLGKKPQNSNKVSINPSIFKPDQYKTLKTGKNQSSTKKIQIDKKTADKTTKQNL